MCDRMSKNERLKKKGWKGERHLVFQKQTYCLVRAGGWGVGLNARGSSQGGQGFHQSLLQQDDMERLWKVYSILWGPAGLPWKLLNWEMSESGCRVEQCFVSEGESSFAHQEPSQKKPQQQQQQKERAHRGQRHRPALTAALSFKPSKEPSPTKADQNLFAGYQSVSLGL